MISDTHSTEGFHARRIIFAPLQPKRRFKLDIAPTEHEPVLVDARTELRRHRERIHRSGRPNIQWRRLTSPTEFSELLPNRSRPPVLAKVVDKIKTPRFGNGHRHGIWEWLRGLTLAFR